INDDKWKELDDLWLYNPRLVEARIVRQKGLFTIQGLNVQPVINRLKSSHELVTHSVPVDLKKDLLEILYRMGIDRSTLFADPGGLCDRLNWETKNRMDRSFPPVTGSRVLYVNVPARSVSAGSANMTIIDGGSRWSL